MRGASIFHLLSQTVKKQKAKVLSVCATLIKLGDEGPYAGLIEELTELIRCCRPKQLLTAQARRHAPSLRRLLKGLMKRIERGAMKKLHGLAHIVDTELSGQGGCSLYDRLDRQLAALDRVSFKSSFSGAAPKNNYVNVVNRGGPVGFRGGRNRGQPGAHRGTPRGRDAQGNIVCYTCYESGHISSQCPEKANAGANVDNI